MKAYRAVTARLVECTLLCGVGFSAFSQTNIELLTTLSGNFGPLAISGNYLFSAGSSVPPAPALRIFDISDPAHPTDLGYQDGGGSLTGIALSGARAYIGAYPFYGYSFGLSIVDISNPTNPTLSGVVQGVPTDAIGIYDSKAYVMNDYERPAALGIYDVSNPTQPLNLGTITWPQDNPSVRWLFPTESHLFSVGFYGMCVHDISNPASARVVGGPIAAGALGASGATLSGDYLYVTDFTNGLWVANVSCPTNPVIVYHRYWLEDFRAIVTSGNYAYVALAGAYGGTPGIWAFDVTNPTNTSLVVSRLGFDYAAANSLAISKGYLYASDSGILRVFSVGGPAPPQLTVTSTATNTLLLSWGAPAPAFAVQQNSDLKPTNWHTLNGTPVVVGGRNQVMVPKAEERMFYRLISQ